MKKQFMKWKRQFAALLAVVMILSSVLPAGATFVAEGTASDIEAELQVNGEDAVRIPIFETTDVHGHTVDISSGNPDTYQYRMPFIANVVKEARASEAYNGVILLDGGDIYQGHPVSNEYYGEPISAIFQTMGYDAVTLGNHEFDWGIDKTVDAVDQTMTNWDYVANEKVYQGVNTVPVLACNIYDKQTDERVSYTKDYEIIEKGGKKIAVIGYVSDYAIDIMTTRFSDYYYIDADVSVPNAIAKSLKDSGAADAVIVLAHASPASLAKELDPDYVDIVFGGHSHTSQSGVGTNEIPYLQGNCKAQGYAYAELVFDASNNVQIEEAKYVDIRASGTGGNRDKLYNTAENIENYFEPDVYGISQDALTQVLESLSEVLGTINVELTKTFMAGTRTSTAGTWSTDLIRRATETDAAFNNSGGIRTTFEFDEGATSRAVTSLDLLTMFPFGNELPAFEVTGQELWDIATYAVNDDKETLQMSGLTVSYYLTTDNEGKEKRVISRVIMDSGDDLSKNLNKKYTVATNEYVATMSGSPFLTISNPIKYNDSIADSVAFLEVLRAEKAYNAQNGIQLLAVDTAPKASEDATGISLNYPTTNLKVDGTIQLTAAVVSTVAKKAISWTTDSESVATVSANGLVTAKANGTAKITATVQDGGAKSATCTVTVTTDVSKVNISQSTLTVAKGKSETLTASVMPSTASDQKITWSSSNEKIAKVDSSTGKVSGVAKGKATITATSTNKKTATCEVTVAEVKLNVTSAKLQVGKTTKVIKVASKYPSSDSVKSWKSSNKSFATITDKGVITGKKAGTTTITVTMKSGATATCKLTVQKNAVTTTKLAMSSSKLTLLKGKNVTLTANRTPVTATDKITWTTSNKKVATVTSNGKVTATSTGTATITAKTANKKTTKCVITVPGVTLKSTKGTVKVGKKLTISIKSKTPKSDTIASCKSNKTNIATVTNKGKITGKKAGTAKITVTMKSGAKATFTVTVKK